MEMTTKTNFCKHGTGQKFFTQNEVNHIITIRLKRERERLTKEMGKSLNTCLLFVQEMVSQELAAMRREMQTETKDTLLSNK